MPSQFFGLYIAGSGLRNSNAALNTTANNIANVQTEGYSRQQVDSQAADALRTFTTYGCAGAGVDTIAIERVRDNFYDVKFWNNNSNLGNYSAKAYYMKTIEDYFNDDGQTGFVTVFNKLSNSLQSVLTNPSSTSSKAQFVAAAQGITDYFNNIYGNLQELQEDVNLEIKQCVDQINSISEQIATLNKQINVIELTGAKANDLRDQRGVLIDRLSEYMDVDVVENPIYDTNDPTRETGGTRFVVKIAGGQILVDANDYSELKYVARTSTEKINQTDVDGLYKITWDNGNEFNLNSAALNGKLKGLVEVRDGNNGVNFTGKITSVPATVPDASVHEYNVTLQSSDPHFSDNLMECNLSSTGGEIKIGNGIYYYKDWSFDEATKEYTFIIDNDKTLEVNTTPITVGSDAQTQDAIKYQGIPYYMAQLTTFCRTFMKKINETVEDGIDAYGDLGANLFTAILPPGYELTQAEIDGTCDVSGTVLPKDGYYFFTPGTVKISTEMLRDADRLGYRTKNPDPSLTQAEPLYGIEESAQIEKVYTMLTDRKEFNFRNAPANQMLELVLSDVALNASNANTYENTYKGLKNSIDNQRTAISGVDEDEEAVSLVKYQNSYTLASKMIQTLTEIYDQLILRTGV